MEDTHIHTHARKHPDDVNHPRLDRDVEKCRLVHLSKMCVKRSQKK